MKLMIDKGQIANILHDSYIAGNPVYDNSFIQITSYASDIDMKDVETNQAWKFKIVDGELQYDQEKIALKLESDAKRKREARYNNESDVYLYTFLEELALHVATPNAVKWLEEKAKIKKEIPTE